MNFLSNYFGSNVMLSFVVSKLIECGISVPDLFVSISNGISLISTRKIKFIYVADISVVYVNCEKDV